MGGWLPRGVRECNNNAAFFFARNLPAVAETSEAQGGFANSVPTRLTDTSLQKSATTGSLFFVIFHCPYLLRCSKLVSAKIMHESADWGVIT